MRESLYIAPDISSHNGVVNMKEVREQCKAVFIRAGYGKNNVDQRYIANAEACYNLNVPVMIYWFSYGYTAEMADKEAGYAIFQAKKYWKKCPIAFDLEYDTVRYARQKNIEITKTLATDMAIAFLKRVLKEGYIPVIYTNRDYLKNYFDNARINKEVGVNVPVWFAYYSNNEPTEVSGYLARVWQYTSKGKLNGISGNVDINKVYVDIFDDSNKTERESTGGNINIRNFQKACNADGIKDENDNYLIIDGLDGKHTQAARNKINLKAKGIGLIYRVGSTGAVVRWWQTRLNEIMGCNLIVDGKFGADTRKWTIEYQRKYQLKADGIAGYNTLQSAFYN